MPKTGMIAGVILVIAIIAVAAAYVATQPGGTTTTTSQPTKQWKIALLLPDVITDLTWNGPAYQAVSRLVAEGVADKFSYTEQVAVPDAVRIASGYAAEGYDLIIQHGAQFVDTTREAAQKYPNSYFVTTALLAPDFPSNASVVWSYLEEAYYLLGILAGRMTKTNIVGTLCPLEVPGIVEWSKGFKAGVLSVNPHATVLYAVTGSFMDATLGKEAAMAQIESGADFLAPMTDGPVLGAIMAAQETGKAYVFGCEGDTHSINPNIIVTSAIWDSYSHYKTIMLDIKAGQFKSIYPADLKTGGVTLTPFYALKDKIPQTVLDEMEQAKQDIISGKINVKELVQSITL
ncbi:MAG: BMP family protein [Candidatus Hadarchaeum sp.]|uniref:BMP family protein n=1 Tax=Candidatus Hadarchaeum sp. TaxID=2883567 RepID=UPI00317E7DD9